MKVKTKEKTYVIKNSKTSPAKLSKCIKTFEFFEISFLML